ncbi:hypothetical protein AF332_19535 [Sporosarcina globispora]|uniref:histidine kinase n=1 Tax=Sporosarcina globispora TaxID=1459 RepID=A0A0M0GFY9_SPOGL|nr:hypothetical protein AF332_19535 [Sporosarcina globispora]
MIIAFLIAIIGVIPLVLAISVLKLYKGSELASVLLLYMVAISFWQIDIAVLYLDGIFPAETITLLFKIFRIGPIIMVPIVFYLCYVLIKKHTANIKNQRLPQFLYSILNRKVLFFLSGWSLAIYLINFTPLGILGLKKMKVIASDYFFYFPEYGPLHILFVMHTASIIVFVLFSFVISKLIQNTYLKAFLSTFSFCSLLLFFTGLFNFIPGTGALFSSLGVIIFSVIIVFSFVRMHTMITVSLNRLMERQKKLDEAGNLAASLVHEVKNTLQIINGYSKLLNELSAVPPEGKKMNEMVFTASLQLEGLINNYTQYITHKSIEFKMVDLNEVLEQAIEISQEFIIRNSAEVTFDKKYKTLKTYANQTYLKQVFVNLIKNSSEAFLEDKAIRNITISTDIQGDRIHIHIIDTGKGIPYDELESIFDPFHSTKKDGMGLGLPFVKNIILEHRGEIKVLDSSVQGTHIEIILPQYSFSNF